MMAATVKHSTRKANLSVVLIYFLCIFLHYALCDEDGNGTRYSHTVAEGEEVVLECNHTLVTAGEGKKWLYNSQVPLFRLKIRIDERQTLQLLPDYSLVITNLSLEHDGLYQCVEGPQIIANHFLSVEVSPAVNVSISFMSHATIIPTNRFIEVTCTATESKPAVNLTWLLNNHDVDPTLQRTHDIFLNSDNNKTLDTVAVLNFQPQSSPLNITCVVHGFMGKEYHHIVYYADYEKRDRFIIGCACGLLMLISCALGFCIRRSYSVGSATLNNVPVTYEKSINIPDNHSTSHYQDLIRADEGDPFEGTFKPSDGKAYEVPSGDNPGIVEKLHGEGLITYWKVSSQKTENIMLRKCLSEKAKSDDQSQFRDLAICVMSIPKHRNIVETIRITLQVPYCIYQEYLDAGDLKDFLSQTLQPQILYDNDGNVKLEDVQVKLAKFVLDIVDAMVFLSKEKLRHPALCTRKVLLDNVLRCKLYDFWPRSLCLSRIQRIIQKPNPPVAWLAPETSSALQYSEKSDVWSFATFIWEMYSFGDIPYEDMTCAEISRDIKSSIHLNQPDFCPRNLYDIMLASWTMTPEERPSFDQIRQILSNTEEFKDENVNVRDSLPYAVLDDDTKESENVYE